MDNLTPEEYQRLLQIYKGHEHFRQFELTQDANGISAAMDAFHTALAMPQAESGPDLYLMGNISRCYLVRYQVFKSPIDLETAITLQKELLDLTPPGHDILPNLYGDLGMALAGKYDLTQEVSVLRGSVGYLRGRAEECTNVKQIPTMLNNLVVSLMGLFDITKELKDLDEAIQLQKRGVEMTSEGNEDLPKWLDVLGKLYHTRYEHSYKIEDIRDAAVHRIKAISLSSADDPQMPSRLDDAANSLREKFHAAGIIEDITFVFTIHAKAVEMALDRDPDLSRFLGNFSESLMAKFSRMGDIGRGSSNCAA